MNTVGTIDSGTLSWVKAEIDQTLEQARAALQGFSEKADDLTPVRLYANHLHQVAGTLQMVELNGAAMLAQEAESLADAVINRTVGDDLTPATTLLASSLTGLSDYLNSLHQGLVDTPLHNLDLMNELRGLRGEPPLEEYSLFYPDLEVYPTPQITTEKLDADQYKERIKKIRREYQVVLLNWLRDGDSEQLDGLAMLATELQRVARFGSISQLWWLANAFAVMLRSEDLQPDDVRKHVFGRLDQVLRKLIEGGEALVVKQGTKELVTRMLYDIGRSDSKMDAVRNVRREFDLDVLLQTDVEGFRVDLTLEILSALHSDVADTLRTIQRELSGYFDSEDPDPHKLERAAEELETVVTHASEKNFDELAELAQKAADVARQVKEFQIDKETAALPLAESLLFAEETLRRKSLNVEWKIQFDNQIDQLQMIQPGFEGEISVAKIDEDDERSLSDADVKQLTAAVADEVQVNLKKAEEVLEEFAKNFGSITQLEPVPNYLTQVQGAFQMLGHRRAADMLATAGSYTRKLLRREIEPNATLIDALAVSIGTSQMFVEGLENDQAYIHEMVDRAIHDLEDALAERDLVFLDPDAAMESLRMALEDWFEDSADFQAFRLARSHLRDISATAHKRSQAKAWQIAQEMNNLLDIVTEDPSFLSPEIEETLRRSLETLTEYKDALASTPTVEAEQETETDAETDEFHQEILDIFKEEARECIQKIDELFEDWRNDPLDQSLSMDLRRQFHTLKGSGRTANAGPIAELAWTIENLLNHVIDQQLNASENLFVFIIDAKTAIADLVERDLAKDVQFDLGSWERRASSILDGSDVSEDVDAESDGDLVDEAQPGAGSGAEIDDTVAHIFTQETLEHLRVIREFIHAATNDAKPANITPELSRAIHTLRGSSRSLHLVEMSNVFGSLDDHLNVIAGTDTPLSTDDLSLLETSTILSAKVLDRLNQDRTFPAALREEFDMLQHKVTSRTTVREVKGQEELPESFEPESLESHIELLEDLITEDLDAGVRPAADTTDDFSLEVRDVFCEEAIDLLLRINSQLTIWRDGSDVKTAIASLRRELHTLKGSARAAGINTIGDLSHNTETLLEQTEEISEIDTAALNALLEEVHDALFRMVQEVEQHQIPHEEADLNQRVLLFRQELITEEPATTVAPVSEVTDEELRSDDDLDVSREQESPVEISPVVSLGQEHSVTNSGEESIDVTDDDAMDELADEELPVDAHIDTTLSALEAVDATPAEVEPPYLISEDGLRGEESADLKSDTSSPDEKLSKSIPESVADFTPAQPVTLPAQNVENEASPPQIAASLDSDNVAAAETEGDGGRSTFRVKAQVLDKLVNYAGEVSISRSQMQEQLSDLSTNLTELRGNVARFSDQLRELDIQADSQIRARAGEPEQKADNDFDPLELDRYTKLQQLSRSLSESLDDLVTIQGGLTQFASRTETTLQQQAHMSTELQEGLMSARLIPFSDLVPRLRYQARQTARELGKQAELQVTGGDVEVDRKVLDNMAEPLNHMIRNALSHGIESPSERAATGKNSVGTIKIACEQEGNEIVIRFSDDGRGLNVNSIRNKAVDKGLFQPNTELNDHDIMQLIVTPGFSTTEKVTKLSGRGVGMDVVDNSIRHLGGSIILENTLGQGVTFIIRLPLSLSITQALFVRCGVQEFAISVAVIKNVVKAEATDVRQETDNEQALLERDGQVYPLMDLTERLNLESTLNKGERVPVLLVRMGARVVAIQVDEFLGTQEVVVKPLGTHVSTVAGIGGATIRGDGSIVIILDLSELWLAQQSQPGGRQTRQRSAGEEGAPVVMVVDDSLTVRKVTARNLTRNGMQAILAKDGVDALERIRLQKPDLMLVDIEMPRMDGYELTERIRGNADTRDIPIIIITSRAGAKHKDKAMKLGADAYLSKPYQEDDLLRDVAECLAKARAKLH